MKIDNTKNFIHATIDYVVSPQNSNKVLDKSLVLFHTKIHFGIHHEVAKLISDNWIIGGNEIESTLRVTLRFRQKTSITICNESMDIGNIQWKTPEIFSRVSSIHCTRGSLTQYRLLYGINPTSHFDVRPTTAAIST